MKKIRPHSIRSLIATTLLASLVAVIPIAHAASPTPSAPYTILSANPANLDMTLAVQPTIVRVSPSAATCRYGVFIIAPGASAAALKSAASTAATAKQAVSFDYSIDADKFCIVSAITPSTATVTASTIKPAFGSPGNPDVGVYDGYHNAFATAHKSAFRDFGQGKFDESVDPITGRLWMTHTDVVVPGVNGLDIRVMRNYISPDAEQIANGLGGLEPEINGFGWHVIANFGGVRGMVAACSLRFLAGENSDYDGYYLRAETLPQWINAKGQPEPLMPVPNEGQQYANRPFTTFVWRTASGTTVECGYDDYHPIATLPDGTKIEMNATTTDYAILGAWNAFPTKITDRWGNWLSFEWDMAYSALFFAASNYRQGHMARTIPITRITSSDGREVRFVYESMAPSWLANPTQPIPVTEKILKRIEYGTHKVEYSYDRMWPQGINILASSSAKYLLRRVDTPDGLNWRYEYWGMPTGIYPAAGDAALKTLTYPHGGTATYEWGGSKMTTQISANSLPVSKSFQLRKKTTQPDNGVWRYSYTDMVRTAADEANDPIPSLTGYAASPTDPNAYLEAGRITGPASIEVFHHFPRYADPNFSNFQNIPENYTSAYETWRLGRLVQHTTYALGTTFSTTQAAIPLEKTTQTYVPITYPLGGFIGDQQSVLPIRHGACSDPRCPAGDTPAVDKYAYLVRPVTTTIKRGTSQYVTSNDAFMAFCGKPTTVTETGQRNRSTVYVFDRAGYCQATSQQLNENSTRRSRTASTLTVDKLAVATETHFGPTDTGGLSTSYTYLTTGELNTKTDANGFVTVLQDYWRGTPKTEWHPVAAFNAATDTQRITITRLVDDLGRITSETDGEGHTMTATYNGMHKPTNITLPRAASASMAFGYGATSDTITRGNRIETVGYDGFGRVTSYNDGINTTSYGYDAAGRRTFVSFPDSVLGQSVMYDALGRPTQLTEPDPSANSASSTVDTIITYDDDANAITLTNPRGYATTLTMEAFGDPNSGWLKSRNSPEIGLTSYSRNVFGQIEQITQSGVTRSNSYDAANGYFLTQETHPELGTIYYDRDNNGNATGKRVGSNSAPTTSQTYDGQNRVTSITPAINGTQAGPAINNVWYKNGLLKSTTSTGAATVARDYTYDANNNLSTEQVTVDGTARTLSYSYDALDHLTRMTYPSGKFVDFNPDLLGRAQQVSSSSLSVVTGTTYWPSGLPKKITYANGLTQDFTEQVRPLLSALSITKTANATILMNLGFGYDKVGNQTSITDALALGYARASTYDKFDRILSSTGESFTYEGGGDIKTKSGATFTYDATQRRLQSITGTISRAYTYDAFGNAITDGRGFGYSFDALNSLRQVKLNAVVTASYDYDGHQHLAKKAASDGTTTHYLYGMNGRLFGEYIPATSKSKEYFFLGNKMVGQLVKGGAN